MGARPVPAGSDAEPWEHDLFPLDLTIQAEPWEDDLFPLDLTIQAEPWEDDLFPPDRQIRRPSPGSDDPGRAMGGRPVPAGSSDPAAIAWI
ncbi:MAG: hypothetical protein M5U01_05340 [Ardenticatenaceae bacterium]|nr:hypothetical protein [Ardenticatenaceae bacterium]